MLNDLIGGRFWMQRLMAGVVLLCGAVVRGDEVLTLSGNNPNVGLVDNVGAAQSWQVLGNDLGFQVRDVTGTTLTPFRILPNAPTNSLYVDAAGLVGMGTLPGADLHVRSKAINCSMFLEGSEGNFWRLLGGKGGFSIDELNGDFPFVIERNVPTNALYLATNGSVGLGTNLPNNTGAVTGTGKFFNVRADGNSAATGVCNGVFQGTFGAQNHLVHLNAATNQKIMRLQCSSGFFGLHVLSDNLATKTVADCLSIKMSNGNVGLRVQNPAHPLHLASGAHVTAGGVFTNASSRELKQAIEPITSEQARETVRKLQPVGYRYKEELDEQYVGFIAEDVPELVATKDRKSLAPMDVVAVLTKVVQDQEQSLDKQERKLTQQERQLVEERQRSDKLERLVESLMQRMTDLEQQRGSEQPE